MHIVEKVLRRQGLGFVAEAGKVSNDEERNLLSQNMLPTLNGKIIISTDERTSEELTKIIKTISENALNNRVNELGFYMFGYEKDNGDVIITDIIPNFEEYYTAINEGRKVSCAFEEQSRHMKSFKLIEESIDRFAKYSKYKRPVILSGHTHPDLSPIYGPNSRFSSGTNFSWCDVRGLIETEKMIVDMGTEFGKDVQYGHILINGILDFDVISYQNFGDGYKLYKHPEIYFGDDRLRSFTKNKYLIKDDVEKTF